MSNAMFGWTNWITAGGLQAGSETAGLGAVMLQDDRGSPSTAWQTAAALTPSAGAWLIVDSGSATSTWRAFCLARTNLTAAAQIRWRVGNAESLVEQTPALLLDFTTGSFAVPAGWAFTRSTGGTRINSAGTMDLIPAGTLRLDYRPDTLAARGYLLEPARTNLWTNGNSLAGLGTGAGNTVAASTDVPALYPAATVGKATYSPSAGDTNVCAAGGTFGAGAAAASVWVWIPASLPLASLALGWEGAGITGGTTAAADLTKRNQWQRISATATLPGTSCSAVLRLNGAASGSAVYVTCWQVEDGGYGTSYIPTAGAAASRAADSMSGPAALAGAALSLALESEAETGAVNFQAQVTASDGTASNQVALYCFGAASYSATSTVAGTTSFAANITGAADTSPFRHAVAISGGAYSMAEGGAVTATGSLPVPPGLNTLALSGNGAWIRRVLAYTVRLSDAQLAALTGTGSTVTGAVAYDSGLVAAGVVAGLGQSVAVAPADATGQFARLDISDPTNPDGFVNIPLAYAGPVWQPATNVSYASTVGRDDQVDELVTRGGQEFPAFRWARRRWNVDLQGVRSAELWAQVMDLDRVARFGGNVLFIPNPAGAYVAQETILGRLKAQSDVSFPFGSGDRRGWKANVTERL